MFRAGQLGGECAQFIDLIDPNLAEQFGSLNKEQLLAFISTDPLLGHISKAPRLEPFVDEFMEYFAGDGELAPEPANATA